MKQVTSEDLWMIYIHDSVLTQLNHMRFFETQYPSSQVGKDLQPNLHGELAKIVMRYVNEAKPSGERKAKEPSLMLGMMGQVVPEPVEEHLEKSPSPQA